LDICSSQSLWGRRLVAGPVVELALVLRVASAGSMAALVATEAVEVTEAAVGSNCYVPNPRFEPTPASEICSARLETG